MTSVVALIPACNEETGVVATIRSIQDQSLSVDRIVVVANNCEDRTAEVSREVGADVVEMPNNPDRKAGALNHGLSLVMPDLEDDDMLLVMDADSVLCDTWVADAVRHLQEDPSYGAVSGAYVARKGRGLVTLVQRAEYAQERRRISRRQGNISVLSGAAVLIPVRTFQEILGIRELIYDPSSLTEDFEITLMIRTLGYSPRCFQELRVVTDVMENWSDLTGQRVRWQRGTIETLLGYGWSPLTRRIWAGQVLAYGMTLVLLLMIMAWTVTLLNYGTLDLRWLVLLPVFVLEQVVSSRKAGWAPTLVAAMLLPMWIYECYRTTVYWTALTKTLTRAKLSWA